MSVGCEEYARQTGRLLPEIIKVLQPFMQPPHLPSYLDASTIKIVILPSDDPILNPPSANRKIAACVDSRNLWDVKLVFAEGALNRKGWVRDNEWDLSIPEGWWAFSHECHHVWRMPRMTFWERIVYFLQVIFKRNITIENEAVAFSDIVKDNLNPMDLRVFENLRGANGNLSVYPNRPGDVLS